MGTHTRETIKKIRDKVKEILNGTWQRKYSWLISQLTLLFAGRAGTRIKGTTMMTRGKGRVCTLGK